MKPFACAVALMAAMSSGAALAAVLPVAVVNSASAVMSPDQRTIVVSASVDLPNGCWTNPRVAAPASGAAPDADGVVELTVVADSDAGPGMACSMIYRTRVAATPLQWTDFPRQGLRAVRLVGERTPVVVQVEPGG